MATSCSLTDCLSFCLISLISSVSTTSRGALGTHWGATWLLQVRGLFLQHGRHSFQKTKRETTSRARPQKLTTMARRLTEMSAKK
ncbi:hypothetical protein XELAEV_18002863mg [Xenopus laevis]|uniref:Secreted protein n=1 Tax=Xenopus laevis TaxID=8355 RepID=A0A974BNS9_XENLA|nr:hypothetical protein XELAEV_18002863mg [Xenopus laevis]